MILKLRGHDHIAVPLLSHSMSTETSGYVVRLARQECAWRHAQVQEQNQDHSRMLAHLILISPLHLSHELAVKI